MTKLMHRLLLLVVFAPSLCHSWNVFVSQAIAAAVLSTLSLDDGNQRNQLLQSLTPPTPETPQIMIPTRQGAEPQDDLVQPLVQGLVYLANPQQSRPDPSDFLILEVRNLDRSDESTSHRDHIDVVVAGAKVPVSRIRLPLQFTMSERNIIAGQTIGRDNDLLVEAKICPTAESCSAQDATLMARGIAKLMPVKIAGSDGASFRAAASLGLR